MSSLVVTRIWCVTRDQSFLVRILCGLLRCGHIPVLPNWSNKGVAVCKTVYDSPGSGFLYVADKFITVAKGEVTLHSTKSG